MSGRDRGLQAATPEELAIDSAYFEAIKASFKALAARMSTPDLGEGTFSGEIAQLRAAREIAIKVIHESR